MCTQISASCRQINYGPKTNRRSASPANCNRWMIILCAYRLESNSGEKYAMYTQTIEIHTNIRSVRQSHAHIERLSFAAMLTKS